jgi:heat shock protein HtpX
MRNIYESIDINKRNSLLIIGIFMAFVLASGYLLAKTMGLYYGYSASGFEFMGMALIISGISGFISYYFSDKIILSLSGATPATKGRFFTLYTVVENLCLASGLPLPSIYVIEDTAPNAFATGRDPKHAVVCVTTGLLQKLNRTELEGVIGHELSHVANYDIRLMSLVTVLVGLITLMADWLLRSSWRGRSGSKEDRGGSGIFLIIGIVLALLSPLIAKLIQLAISRRREYYADAASVKLTRQPSGLISALKKLEADTEPLEVANKATAHLYIVNPLKNHHDAIGWFSGLFNTHPPISERIKVLQQMT